MAGVLIRRGDQDTWGEMPGIQTHTEKKAVWRQREKVWFASQGRGASWSQPYQQLNLDCLPPELRENKIYLCCLSPLSLGFCCDGPSKPTHTAVLHSAPQPCPTRCNPVDCCPWGSSVYGILQAGRLGWVAISSCRGSSQPKDRTGVSCTAGRFFTSWATSEA